MTHATLQRRLLALLWVYEIAIIVATMAGGAYIALSQGGQLSFAAPILLIGIAEMLRIPIAALSTRIGGAGKALAVVVLLAIAVISFEGLSMVFEMALDNRTQSVMQAQRVYDKAESILHQKQIILSKANATLDLAKSKVAALDADILNKEKSAPVNPGFSGKTCTGRSGRNVTCDADRQARADFATAQRAHIATLTDLREQRRIAQQSLDVIGADIKGVSTVAEKAKADDALQALVDVKSLSPMHKLAASILGVNIANLTVEQFESVKRFGVLGLAGAFAVLSAAVSIVAHQPEHDGSESKLARTLRAWIARRRKGVVKLVEVPKFTGEKVVIRYVPVPTSPEELRRQKSAAFSKDAIWE
jgi:hypothetical protein